MYFVSSADTFYLAGQVFLTNEIDAEVAQW